MTKKILAISIVLLTFAIIAMPVAAILPGKSPLPPGCPWNAVWTLLQDLQKQIKNLQSGNVVIVRGEATSGTVVSPPAGFTPSNCDIIVRPKSGIAFKMVNNNVPYHAIGMAFDAGIEGSTWSISSYVIYDPDSGGSSQYLNQPALYTIICPVTTQ